jgi:hypothetical protein
VAANAAAVAAGGGSARAAALRWGDASHAAALAGEWGVLLAADVVYRRELFAPLAATLRALAGPRTVLVLAHLKRWGSERLFWRELLRDWTPREEVLTQPASAPGQTRPVRVFTCRLREAAPAAAAATEQD